MNKCIIRIKEYKMTRFMQIRENQEIPGGFNTYSALLIPDSRWLNQDDESKSFQLFRRFREFGDAIGPDHLAFWPCRAKIKNYDEVDRTNLEIFSIVSDYSESYGEIRKSIIKKDPHLEKSDRYGKFKTVQVEDINEPYYDIIRAKYFCAKYGLDFNSGPYIAFFEKKPIMPIVYTIYPMNSPGKEVTASSESPTKPAFLLQFKDMNFDQALSTINVLEYEILRDTFNMNMPRWSQFKFNLQNWCNRIGNQIGIAAIIIKDIIEVSTPIKEILALIIAI
jgi:hypothetical protein